MVAEVLVDLQRNDHPGLTASHEFAMQAIDKGATNAAALARSLGVTRQAAAKTIVNLESLGYLARGSDAADGRRKGLVITAEGRRAIAIGSAAFDRLRERWIETVGPRRAATTEQALRALRDELRSRHRSGDR